MSQQNERMPFKRQGYYLIWSFFVIRKVEDWSNKFQGIYVFAYVIPFNEMMAVAVNV